MESLRQGFVVFGRDLARTLVALVTQFAAPLLALYLFLVIPPLFGCLGYSDRPGPGCRGFDSRLPLGQFAQYAADMASYPLFAALFLWPVAFLCVFIALMTRRRPRTRSIRATALGVIGFLATGYLITGVGWYFALSGLGALMVALVGGAVAACIVPRLIPPVQRSNNALERSGFAGRSA